MRPKYPSDKKSVEYSRKFRQEHSHPCIDCGKLCTRGKRCISCAVKLNWQNRRGGKMTKTIKYYGSIWQKARKETITKANGICQRCHKLPVKFVHHSLPIRLFANLDDAHFPSNLTALCKECHTREHKRLASILPLLDLLQLP